MPLEPPKLDDRSYEELLSEALARIPVYAPEWTDHDDDDPCAFVALFGFLAEATAQLESRHRPDRRADTLTLLRELLHARLERAERQATAIRCALDRLEDISTHQGEPGNFAP